MRRSLRLCKKRNSDDDVVPMDLLIEVLHRLPVKSVGRFVLVSKTWAKIIRSKCFIRSFPFRSLTDQPLRLLIGLSVIDDQTGHPKYCLFSSSSVSSSSTSITTSFLSRVPPSTTKKNPRRHDYAIYYVNGLMCIGEIIFNPCTGKSITLPRGKINTSRSTSVMVKRFFGYEPVNDEYKVLYMAKTITRKIKKMKALWSDPWSDIQVFTLGGAKQKSSWRLIDCSVPHSPLSTSTSICIDGAVYYIAYTGTGKIVVKFDLKSEKFDIFARFSEYLRNRNTPSLINYYGKVATAIQPLTFDNTIELLVFEAGKHGYVERIFHSLPERYLTMKGINHYTGEIIFAPKFSKDEAYVICYDLKGASCKKIKIVLDANPSREWFLEGNYFVDYVDSLMLL